MVRKSESYEDMMNNLEELLQKMESQELSLEEMMKNYEEGIKLCNKLYKILNKAEGQIKILSEFGEEDFYSKE